MFNNPAIEKLGRRLRLAVVGGGAESLIGQVHRTASRLDDRFEVVASVLSSQASRSREQGVKLGLAPERAYGTLKELLESESQRQDPVEVVAIMTPNHCHYADCVQVLDKRLHILCDKPLATNLNDAIDLVDRVRTADRFFVLPIIIPAIR